MSKPITYDLSEIITRLSGYFPADQVKSFPMQVSKNTGKGLAAFYIDARAVQTRLDETCVWRNEPFQEGPQGGVMAGISILIQRPDGAYEWVTRWDGAENTDIEAIKGGFSDSMRRAAVAWGIGRYLYNVPGQWVEMKEGNRFFKTPPRIPAEFLPSGAQRAQKVAPSAPPPVEPAKASAKKEQKSDEPVSVGLLVGGLFATLFLLGSG